MILPSPDDLHRTLKLEMDDGKAGSYDGAQEIARKYVLQIDVGEDVVNSLTRQAMLLTAVNAGCRAFRGGVRVRLYSDNVLRARWAAGEYMAEAVKQLGGTVVDSLDPTLPTLVIGAVPTALNGDVVLHATWQGWAGGVVEHPSERLDESEEFPLTGVLASAIGVSEAFQRLRGDVQAGRRSTGLSLWRPSSNWRAGDGYGPQCEYLPSRLWLIGLGHLGQAYAWALGLLPYADADTGEIRIVLQDTDSIVPANLATGMLTTPAAPAQRKTRFVAERLEMLGFQTTIVERLFDEHTRRASSEPGVALVGVDQVSARRRLGNAGFDLVVDAGLGGTAQNYLDMLIRAFPADVEPKDAWPPSRAALHDDVVAQPAYRDLAEQLKQDAGEPSGVPDDDIACGIVQIAGLAVGSAFVGCIAATLVLSEVIRALHDGPRFQVVDLSLRRLDTVQAVPNPVPFKGNLGFVHADTHSIG